MRKPLPFTRSLAEFSRNRSQKDVTAMSADQMPSNPANTTVPTNLNQTPTHTVKCKSIETKSNQNEFFFIVFRQPKVPQINFSQVLHVVSLSMSLFPRLGALPFRFLCTKMPMFLVAAVEPTKGRTNEGEESTAALQTAESRAKVRRRRGESAESNVIDRCLDQHSLHEESAAECRGDERSRWRGGFSPISDLCIYSFVQRCDITGHDRSTVADAIPLRSPGSMQRTLTLPRDRSFHRHADGRWSESNENRIEPLIFSRSLS